jgi:hypothetical protein
MHRIHYLKRRRIPRPSAWDELVSLMRSDAIHAVWFVLGMLLLAAMLYLLSVH